jgi:hypothetical protein
VAVARRTGVLATEGVAERRRSDRRRSDGR